MEPRIWLPLLAGTLGTIGFAPQAWDIIVTNNTEGISLSSQAILFSAMSCWTSYGVVVDNWAVIASSATSAALTGFIFIRVGMNRYKAAHVRDEEKESIPSV